MILDNENILFKIYYQFCNLIRKPIYLKFMLVIVFILNINLVSFAQFRHPDSTGPVQQGLVYSLYKGSFSTVNDFISKTPNKTDTCSYFNISQITNDTSFGVIFSGFIDIIFDGNFTFYLNSKDGSVLYIGDSIIVNNDGIHLQAQQKSGTISLATGKHKFSLLYFSTTKSPALEVRYECNDLGISNTNIPPEILFMPYIGPLPEIKITSPKKGDIYYPGDTINIEWTFTKGINHSVFIDMSLDNGKFFFLIRPSAYIMTSEYGNYKYVIPEDDSSFFTENAIIWIGDYVVGGPEGFSEKFSIKNKSNVLNFRSGFVKSLKIYSDKNIIKIYGEHEQLNNICVEVFDIKGSKLPIARLKDTNILSFKILTSSKGLFTVAINTNQGKFYHKIMLY